MADTAVTISKLRVTPLLNPEKYGGFNYRARVLHTDIAFGAGATDTVTLTLGSTPGKWQVSHALVNVTTAFAGTGAMTVQVGTTAQAAAFVAATTILAAAPIGVAGNAVASFANSTAQTATLIKAVFTNATSGSPSALSAGVLDIYLRINDLVTLAR